MQCKEPIKPRAPFLLRRVPKKYYEDNQLAGVIQCVEAMLTAVCFNQYPQAFMTLYGGIEKLCKNIADLDKKQNFWESLRDASIKLNLQNHTLFEKKSGKYKYQQYWSDFRNEFEHHGDSPSFDLEAANLILGEAWESLKLILLKGKEFDIEEAFLPETLNAFKLSKETREKIHKTSSEIEYPYFMNPLVSHLRYLLSSNFAPAQFNYERYHNSGNYFNDLDEWKKELNNGAQNWESIRCPACSVDDGQFGFKVIPSGDESKLFFTVFICPSECGLIIQGDNNQPFLSEICLAEPLSKKIDRIKTSFSLNNLEICWN